MSNKPIRTDVPCEEPYGPEHDSCALYLSARKNGQSTFGTLKRALWRLANMGHRTGYVRGEGDGAGVQTDIPRILWAKKLSQSGLPATMATQSGFWVGHLFLPYGIDYSTLQDQINTLFTSANLNLLIAQPGPVRTEFLGSNAQLEPPTFWQLAGSAAPIDLEKRLFKIKTDLESLFPIHFASLSSFTVVYKMRGSVETLARYYPELQDRNYDTVMALCHARYSTNTVSNFERAQPFALLGHNGEINTITRFRQEAAQLGIRLPRNGSDSQDVDRALESLCIENDLSLMEAMETIFPPTPFEIDRLSGPMREIYQHMTLAFGPFTQGPAAIGARYGDTAVCSLDALGLRPLWFSETEKEYIFSSERGAIQLEDMVRDSRPFSPGEKMGLVIHRGQKVEVLSQREIRQSVMRSALRYSNQPFPNTLTGIPVKSEVTVANNNGITPDLNRNMQDFAAAHASQASSPQCFIPAPSAVESGRFEFHLTENGHEPILVDDRILAAAGWNREHVQDIGEMAANAREPICSLGFDGPLAALSSQMVNIADYFKETVAVVTNPAIDRGREMEAFSTQVIIGSRPSLKPHRLSEGKCLLLKSPLLLDQQQEQLNGYEETFFSIEELSAEFAECIAYLSLGIKPGYSLRESLDQLTHAAIQAVSNGAACLIIDDEPAIRQNLRWLDPLLAVAAIDNALSTSQENGNLRRKTGLVVRSACIRNLHDIILLCSFGADAVNPYAMLSLAKGLPSQAASNARKIDRSQINLFKTLQAGLEKVISTVGCHELRGYGRICGSIGLSPEIANIFHAPNFLGSNLSGLNWSGLENNAENRVNILLGKIPAKIEPPDRLYPKFWKSVNRFINGESSYEGVVDHYKKLTDESPVSLRHLMRLKTNILSIPPDQVDLSVMGYDLPLIFSAMSFGSQGESAFKAYAMAAKELNIICINGEGGEIPSVLGKYPKHRGQQVASGRFGVNAALLNSCGLIEIKIGQGAKPGEGGMLPREKVNPKVAQARHTPPYVALLSPSNNHDLYSIEDLAQLIEELKTVNPLAKISVKCPCVPGIGVIAVGVAKAGADIINLSGYDGATGAARKHAIQHVGLPAEIGVVQAHRALVDAGIREKVELWCDGGMKTGLDVFKMILLGANRVGFATMAMLALGCTVCRKCNQGTCHKGITTHITSLEEAQQLGLKAFTPLNENDAVHRLVRLFTAIGEELRQLAAGMGSARLQDLVGKADLMEQSALLDKIDLSAFFETISVPDRFDREPGVGRLLTRDRNQLTRSISESILRAVNEGEREVTYHDEVMAYDRALGSHLFGALTRQAVLEPSFDQLHLRFSPSSIGGNGFAAWSTDGTDVVIEGGAQDGVAKGASGGRVAIMKGLNHDGLRIDGSVGKSFAYGAQKGTLIVQGNADSRACIRLSGADVVLGGMITDPVDDQNGSIGATANLKGFACEYMTSGRVVILGDPGPYAFSGMTGGVVYQMLTPELGFTRQVLLSRIGRGAHVNIADLEQEDLSSIEELLNQYQLALSQTDQPELAEWIHQLCEPQSLLSRFVKIIPVSEEGIYLS